MKRKLRGLKRRDLLLDFNLYRVDVPIRGLTGAELSVIDIWPEGVEKTILFVHGYAGCAETWEFQINYFARAYRVVAPDLRGHGQSDAPLTQYTMPELVDDLQTIADTLNLPEKFVLVGHSFGGSICVEYANAHPERLEKLVLIATAGEYPLPRRATWAFRLPNAFFRPWWNYRPRWNAEIHVMKRMMLNNMRQWQGWPLLRNITTPTLIITGERDSYFPRYVFDELSKMVPGAEVYDVGSAKHKVQLERHRAVNRAIERFIAGERRSSWRGQPGVSALFQQRPWLASYGPETPLTVPIPRQPLTKFLEGAADWAPKRTATIFYGARLTYQQLNRQVNQFAHALLGLGVGPGERVMVVLPNMPQMIVAYYGTLKAGGVVVLSHPEADAAQIVRQIQQTGARVLVTLAEFNGLIRAAQEQTDLCHFILADMRAMLPAEPYRKLLARWTPTTLISGEAEGRGGLLMAEFMQDAMPTPPSIKVDSEDLAAILYTSGTTDDAKAVCLTHANLVANALQTRHWIHELRYGEEVCLSVVPLSHSYGLTNALNIPIALAATVVLLPAFDLADVLAQIKQYRPTLFPAVPSMYMAINQASHVRAYGLDSIKACVSGAAPLPVEVQEAFEKLTRGRLVEGYGLTEASPVTHANPLYGVRKVGSIGVPIPNTEAKIVDLASGADLPPGQVGELVVKGPQVMAGYWADEAATQAVLRDGWLSTGDVAVMESDGYFQIIGRKKDTITVGSHSVYPRDVEEVLYEHNKVLEATVVGVPADENGQQRVKAFVVPRPGASLSAEDLLALCRRHLDDYAVPAEIEFRETLPKSFVGKVSRRALLEEEQGVDGNGGTL
ncbi:MAG: alpha/beta fold hydrolase [Anaerolineae bacterium]|nr:alpha/beta fold hydrolase [Anaerolineae bacterium]